MFFSTSTFCFTSLLFNARVKPPAGRVRCFSGDIWTWWKQTHGLFSPTPHGRYTDLLIMKRIFYIALLLPPTFVCDCVNHGDHSADSSCQRRNIPRYVCVKPEWRLLNIKRAGTYLSEQVWPQEFSLDLIIALVSASRSFSLSSHDYSACS